MSTKDKPEGVTDEIDILIEDLLDAQQDINLAANERMDQSLCDASALISKTEKFLRRIRVILATANERAERLVEEIRKLTETANHNAECFMNEQKRAEAAHAALPSGVRVKPLEWRRTGSHSDTDLEAATVLGTYTLSFGALSAGGDVNLWVAGADDDTFTTFYDKREAKAAAQADYERRILSAIDPTQAPQPEASLSSGVRDEQIKMGADAVDALHEEWAGQPLPREYSIRIAETVLKTALQVECDEDGIFAGAFDNLSNGGLCVPNVVTCDASGSDETETQEVAPQPTYAEAVAPYAAAIRMIGDGIEQIFGPLASLESEEATLLRGPEPHHRAEGILEALQRVAATLAPAESVEMKRYSLHQTPATGRNFMLERSDGDWVKFSDAQAALTALRAERERLERERDAALEAADEAKDCFWAIYPEWVELKGHGISTEAARTALVERAETAEARNAELEKALGLAIKTGSILLQNSEGCAVNHYGEDFQIHGMPGFLVDCRADLEEASAALRTNGGDSK